MIIDGYIGEVKLFAGTFAPRDWAFCEGQLVSVSEHTALFSIIGTQFGGDGRTSMGLPDLRGRDSQLRMNRSTACLKCLEPDG